MNITSIEIRKESEKLQKTTVPSLKKIEREWFFLDLNDKIVGNWAPEIVEKLRGKNRVDFFPNLDLGNFVVLVNARQVFFTGDKLDKKKYYNHSGYPGGLRERTLREMLEKYPQELAFRIIKGMMPHTKLGNKQLKRLFIYPGAEHKQQAQEKNFKNLAVN